MNFDIFDEDYYLKRYPFLQPAIEEGIIESGLDHFQRFGLELGLTEVSRYYDEAYYLANYPDVAAAVNAGNFPSGLAHFIEFGYEEGRTQISTDYNDLSYRESNPDILPFLKTDAIGETAIFRNALEHFLKFGAEEGRRSHSFFSAGYLHLYPNLIPAIESGVIRTARDHYEKFGQFEDRDITFSGTRGSDTVTAFGVGSHQITGVETVVEPNRSICECATNEGIRYSDGEGEFDTLIGSSGTDTFLLGDVIFPINFSPFPQQFYRGEGEALIQEFNQSQGDRILFWTLFEEAYSLTPVADDLVVAIDGDTIAVIDGGANLTVTPVFLVNDRFNKQIQLI